MNTALRGMPRLWRGWVLLGAVILIALVGAQVSAAPATAANRPRIPITLGTSTNWSGYASLTSLTSPKSGVVTAVSGSWVVPAVDCSVTPTGYSSTWVGIDGYSSGSVEQLGTEQDCQGGAPSYYAWWEMYPHAAYGISQTVQAGDSMTASVTYSASTGRFTLRLSDVTRGWTFTTAQRSSQAARSSAEWVEEAPSSSSGVLPLADFQSMTFTNATATINGVSGPIDGWANDPITMEDGTETATPSGLTDAAGASSFSVVWAEASAPPPPATNTVHVSSITYSSSRSSLSVSITVLDSSGHAVSGANVAASLRNTTRNLTWTGSATTGSTGKVTFTLSRPPSGTYSTTVTGITGTGISWDGVSPPNSYTMSTLHGNANGITGGPVHLEAAGS